MEPATPAVHKNHILRSLPVDYLEHLGNKLQSVDLPLGKEIYRPGEDIAHVYFPRNAVASIVAYSSDGQGTEVGIVGREGAVGLEVLMGADSSPHECIIQVPNGGHRITTANAREEFNLGGPLHDAVLKFFNRLMIQISQTMLCNRVHHVDERLARWLLMCHDRTDGDVLRLTQEFLAIILGVTRVTINGSASELQSRGFIKYSRGHITIADRAGLESSACECYNLVRTHSKADPLEINSPTANRKVSRT